METEFIDRDELQQVQQDFLPVYNCDPTQSRGYKYSGRYVWIPPLGKSGNPRFLNVNCATHLLKHSSLAIGDAGNWLTTDEAVYKSCLESLAKRKVVHNPGDRRIIADMNGNPKLWSLEPEEIAEMDQQEREERLGIKGKRKQQEEKAATVRTHVTKAVQEDQIIKPI
jgi:hypothetical protein